VSTGEDGGADGDGGVVRDGGVQSGSDAGSPGPATLSQQYPGDTFDLAHPALILATSFEDGTTGWNLSSYTNDTWQVVQDASQAAHGDRALKFGFTLSGLQSRGAASVQATARFPLPASGTYYLRYYMRYGTGTARPHHGNNTRVHAPGFDQGGTAGLRPEGDQRFNTTIDLEPDGKQFFYTYWHEMRSGRCNDGSATPGCAGDQGVTYYYGNVFKPPSQTPVDRFEWHCYELKLRANTPNQYDGEQALWIDDVLVGEFKTGTPLGAWLRAAFFTEGEWGTGDRQVPFEGYNFRTSSAVNQVRVTLEIYQQWDTMTQRRADTPDKAEEQAVFYDDVVIASQRIGCRVAP
jgi:hypothetical protein